MGNILILISILLVLIVVLFLVIFMFTKKTKKSSIIIDELFIGKLISDLGSIDNINKCNVVGGRIEFVINDLKLVSLQDLKLIGGKGIFVTGNKIKINFDYDSNKIYNTIIERLK